jgi:chromosome segregation ATPase
MDFNKQLDDLENRVEELKASVTAAAHENHEQLKKRVDEAHAETDQALNNAKQQANAAADKAESSWEQTRLGAKARLDELKAKAQRRRDRVDANFAQNDADLAEADAYDAIDYADWAVENARVAILDAIDARVSADDKAAALV